MTSPTSSEPRAPLDGRRGSEAAPEAASPAWRDRALHRVLQGSTTWVLLVLIAMVVVFSILSPGAFMSRQNFTNIALDSSILLVLAVGATFVIVSGGVDLSVGSVLVCSSVVGAKVMQAIGGDGWGVVGIGLCACLATGLAWGLLNGFLVAKARVTPMIVTLGTLGMALGVALLLAHGADIQQVPLPLSDTIGTGNLVLGIPTIVCLAAAVALIFGLVLATTRFGRHTYAIGSNAEAATRAGVSVARAQIRIYALAGGLAGFGAFLALARFGTTAIASHTTDNLDAITAVILGGASLFGGVGMVAGTVIGVLIPTTLKNGLVIVDVQPYWQQVGVGAVLIAAVYFDQRRRAS
jgi:ribose transport system permease protein